MRVWLQQTPQVATVGYSVLQHRRRESCMRFSRHALQQYLLEKILDPSRQVYRGVLVYHTPEPHVGHPAQETSDRQLQP